jgi:thiosulfate/3-mercaptopyruvate sulfurtransferase
MGNEYLITPQELFELQNTNDIIIIDTRDTPLFEKGHIPNAININEIFTYISLRENGGYEAMQDYFVSLFGKMGLSKEKPVVVYEDAMDNGYGRSCRGWVLLKYLGHSDVKVLHGGYRSWVKSGFPISTETKIYSPTDYQAELDQNIMVNTEQVMEAIEEPSIILLDNRDYAEWIGANSSPYGYNYAPRKGRIPNSVWVEWYKFMTFKEGISLFKDPKEILKICEDIGITPEKTVYVYCFKGARASNTLMALKLAGFKDVRNYFASWNEWSRDEELPIEDSYPVH